MGITRQCNYALKSVCQYKKYTNFTATVPKTPRGNQGITTNN